MLGVLNQKTSIRKGIGNVIVGRGSKRKREQFEKITEIMIDGKIVQFCTTLTYTTPDGYKGCIVQIRNKPEEKRSSQER